MKKWSIIIVAALVATWLVVDTVREFFANETIHYFSSEPHRLLYVAAIAIAGGFAALGFTRLSPRAQRHVRVFAWGAAASTLTAFVGYFVFCLASLSSLVIESGGSGLASKKRRVRTRHWVSCFGFRSQRVRGRPARSGCAGDYRKFRCSRRFPAGPGRGLQSSVDRPVPV